MNTVACNSLHLHILDKHSIPRASGNPSVSAVPAWLGSCGGAAATEGGRRGLVGNVGSGGSVGARGSASSSDSLISVALPESGSAALAAGTRSRKSLKRPEGAVVWLG